MTYSGLGPAVHDPVESFDGRVIDCSCGRYRQRGVYGNLPGARGAFLCHAVQAIADDAGWGIEVWAEVAR